MIARKRRAPIGQNTNKPPGPDPGKSVTTGDRFEYAGRVVDPEGNPVAGAKLHLAYFGYNGQAPPAIRATSDRDGRFAGEFDWAIRAMQDCGSFCLEADMDVVECNGPCPEGVR